MSENRCPSRSGSRTCFSGSCALRSSALLELLLERGELGERRIGIRLLVAAVRAAAVRLGVILLALGAFDAVAFVAAADGRRRPAADLASTRWSRRSAFPCARGAPAAMAVADARDRGCCPWRDRLAVGSAGFRRRRQPNLPAQAPRRCPRRPQAQTRARPPWRALGGADGGLDAGASRSGRPAARPRSWPARRRRPRPPEDQLLRNFFRQHVRAGEGISSFLLAARISRPSRREISAGDRLARRHLDRRCFGNRLGDWRLDRGNRIGLDRRRPRRSAQRRRRRHRSGRYGFERRGLPAYRFERLVSAGSAGFGLRSMR